MSAYLHPRLGAGQTQQEVTKGIATVAALDPEPISKAVLSILATVSSLFSFGYNPNKLNDTAVTEGAQLAYNALWYQLTGEDLGGVTGAAGCVCQPGQCGSQHCAIFDPQGTSYPDVPSGPGGYVDANQQISQATQMYQAGRSKLIRSESYAAYDANFQGALAKFQMVAQAQAADGGAVASSAVSGIESALGISGLPSWVPLVAAIGAIWAIS